MAGNIFITFALLASVFSIIMYYLTYKGYTNTKNLARIGYHLSTIAIIAASAYLLHALLTHQYQFSYVYNYSNSDLSTGMLMSTFWAGQEGSFMLWLLFTAISGLILLEYTSKRGDLEYRVMMIFTLALAFLLVMVSPGLKDPFTFIWSEPTFIDIKNIKQSYLSLPFMQQFTFSDGNTGQTLIKMNEQLAGLLAGNGISIDQFIAFGKGLNPLLNNFWMQIHPPMLFAGFSMATAPFAFAFAALIKNEYKDWVKQSFPWLLAAMMILGLAIMLGGYWAYIILGWGGYWGWDPVENSSLVPWIVGVAAIHTFIIQKKTQSGEGAGRFVKTNLILSILTYLLVLYSTFLTRSGILGEASVHSFVSPGMMVYTLLILFIGTFTVLGFGAIAYRWKYLEKTFTSEDNMLSKELALFTGSVALIAAALIIIVGTSAPIFGTAVEISFYNELGLPIAILLGFLNGLSLLLRWKKTSEKALLDSTKMPLIISIVLTIAIVFLGGIKDFMAILFTFSAVFMLVVNLDTAIKIFKGKKSFLGAYVAHTGIALFMLGVVATGWFTREEQVELKEGQMTNVFGYNLTYTGYTPIENGEKFKFNITVEKDGSSNIIAPVMYISSFNNSLMRDPDIITKFTNDFYVSPVSFEEGGGKKENNSSATKVTVTKGQTTEYNGAEIKFTKFDFPPDAMAAMQSGKDFYIGALLEIEFNGKKYNVEPKMETKSGQRSFVGAKVKEANLNIELLNLDASGKVELSLSQINNNNTESKIEEVKLPSLWVEASIKPFMNLIWIGTLTVVLGFLIAAFRRTKEANK
ncbi:MAG: cytochrome c biogenesis protein CcsA [Chlorobi bacterium]|nr:cytochrome c biogenesis protein CcsA [Chlorobiota bacterium]